MLTPLRRISLIEAVSYLLLLVGAVVKRAGGTELGVTVMGPIHGVLYLIFAFMFLRDRSHLAWPLWQTVTALFVGSLPFGGFWLDRRWLSPLSTDRETGD